MPKHGKNFRAAAEKVEKFKLYSPLEAVKLVKEVAPAKFDETVEAHFRLGIDTRKADQNIRVPSPCPTAPARPFASPCSPRARRLARPRRPAPTSSAPMSSWPPSRVARSTSTRYRYAEHDGQGWPHR